MTRTRIANARLIDAETDHGVADLYIVDGFIEGIGLGGEVEETVDARGLALTPAFLDLHAHLREPGQEEKETLQTGLSAAAAGGFGTVVSMANTVPVVDDPGLVADLAAKGERIGRARLRPAAALSHGLEGRTLTDFWALQRAGAVMITDDGIPLSDSHLMRRACEYASELGLVIQTHAEDPSLRRDGVMNEGRVSQRLGLPGNPASAEAVAIFRDCELSLLTGARVHIAHVTSERGMRVLEWFKEQGAPVSCEVTPQHLTLTDEALETFDPIYKVAPPLRAQSDVDYLLNAVKRGVVDAVASDHAPHTRAEKERDLLTAPFGIANLEAAFPLLYTKLVQTGELSFQRLLDLFTTGPARVMGWEKPILAPGKPADLVLLDLEGTRLVEPERFLSKAKFSPWAGWRLSGWPVTTFVRGVPVYERDRSLEPA